MAVLAPRLYVPDNNVSNGLGDILAGAAEETQRRENLKDQRTKRAVAKQLAAINANDERRKEIEAGFGAADTYGGGPRMGVSAETGSTQGQHLDVPSGVAGQLAAIRSQVGTSLQTGHYEDGVFIPGPLGPRTGPSDAERLASEKHGYQMEEDRANNDARMALATAGDTAAMARLTAQLANLDARAYDQNHIVPESTKYVQRQENYRAGLAHGDAQRQHKDLDVGYLQGLVSTKQRALSEAQTALKTLQNSGDYSDAEMQQAKDQVLQAQHDYDQTVTAYQNQVGSDVGVSFGPTPEDRLRQLNDYAAVSLPEIKAKHPERYQAAVADYTQRLRALNAEIGASRRAPKTRKR